jgi:diacylglycerol kinase (ATP)
VLVTVGNTSSIGGGMRLTPGASVDDGLLDVLVATPLSRRKLLRLLPKVFSGTHVTDEHVSIERGRVITIDVVDREPPLPVVYADGERMGSLPVTLEVVPNALRVLV